MNKKELEENMSKCTYGTKKYFEYNLIEMVNSIYCYNNYGNDYNKYFNDKYIKDYYLDKSYCNGKGRLTKNDVERIVKKQVDYLYKNARIIHNVYTDNEGLTYNSFIF